MKPTWPLLLWVILLTSVTPRCGSSTSDPVDNDLAPTDSKEEVASNDTLDIQLTDESGKDGQDPDKSQTEVVDQTAPDADTSDPGEIDVTRPDWTDTQDLDTETGDDLDATETTDVDQETEVETDTDTVEPDPDVCVAILIDGVENVGTVVDFGTLVRGQKRTLQASICNRCTPELKGVLNDGMIFDGVCQTFTAANVKAPDGTVIDLGDFDPIHVLQLLTIKIQKNECMTLDITYDSTKLPTIPAHLECEVGGDLNDGNTYVRILRGRSVESVTDLAEPECLATGLNCYVGSVCYASNLWNASNTCSTCKPGVSEGSNTMMTDWDEGTICDDGNPQTNNDRCTNGLCNGTAANEPPQFSSIVTGTRHNCALTTGGEVYCWGRNDHGEAGADPSVVDHVYTPVLMPGLNGVVTALGAGRYNNCAAMQAGGAMCWGYNYDGQLGNGTSTNSFVPTAVQNLTEVVSEFSGGEYHMCARLASGAVKCWGLGSSGELGNGDTVRQYAPVDVALPAAAVSVSAEFRHTCAVLETGRVMCWGRNDQGQLGSGTENSLLPIEVPGITNAVSVELGCWHSCALLASKEVACWGHGSRGELGIGDDDAFVMPTAVFFLENPTALAAALQHTCSLSAQGAVQCWGDNDDGFLGEGLDWATFPVDVWGLGSGVKAIATGDGHACAVMEAGGIRCWGNNNAGELGVGNWLSHSVLPVEVVW